MPIMTILEGFEYPSILSYMLYPNDEEKRDQFLAVEYTKCVLKSAHEDDIEVPKSIVAKLIDSPSSRKLEQERKKITKKGSFSGVIFLNLIQMDISQVEASLLKSQYLATDYYKTAKDSDSINISFKTETARKIWGGFRKVAYLWAANQMLVEILGHEEAVKMMDKEDPIIIASFSVLLLERFKDMEPNKHRSSGCILDIDEMWTLPDTIDLPMACIKFKDGLSKHQKKILREFRYPSKK